MALPTNGAGAQTLLSLLGQGGGGGDQLALRDLQNRRASELEDQIGAESGFRDPVSAASILRKGLFLKGLERDMNQDPDTGLGAQQRVQEVEDANNAYQDYEDPMATEMRNDQFGQKLELATAPARVQGQFALDSANSKAQAQLDALSQMMQFGGDRSMSLSGVGSVGAPPRPVRQPQIPGAVLNKLTAARSNMEKTQGGIMGKVRGLLGMADPRQQEFIQARRNAVGAIAPELVDALEAAQFAPGMSPDEKIDVLNEILGDREVNIDPSILYRVLAEY